MIRVTGNNNEQKNKKHRVPLAPFWMWGSCTNSPPPPEKTVIHHGYSSPPSPPHTGQTAEYLFQKAASASLL